MNKIDSCFFYVEFCFCLFVCRCEYIVKEIIMICIVYEFDSIICANFIEYPYPPQLYQ